MLPLCHSLLMIYIYVTWINHVIDVSRSKIIHPLVYHSGRSRPVSEVETDQARIVARLIQQAKGTMICILREYYFHSQIPEKVNTDPIIKKCEFYFTSAILLNSSFKRTCGLVKAADPRLIRELPFMICYVESRGMK